LIPPALRSVPSALSHVVVVDQDTNETAPASDPTPQFTEKHLEMWIEFQKERGKAVSKDTWNMFIDFVRVIDKEFKEYSDEGPWCERPALYKIQPQEAELTNANRQLSAHRVVAVRA
jgi:DCN1-like protein 1/2